MHPSLQVWCIQHQLASSTQIHRTTISIVSYLHTPLSMRMGRVSHSHKMADCISFSTFTMPREEGKKKLRMALNGTDCEADTGISNSKCISYVKSWINSEYDSMHIHIKLKSQPETRFRAVFFFFGSFSSIRTWFDIIWIPLHSIVLSEGTSYESYFDPFSKSKIQASTILFRTFGGGGGIRLWDLF